MLSMDSKSSIILEVANQTHNQNQNISSSFLVPPSPVLILAAHSKQALSEKGKSFIQFLHVGLLHVGQGFVRVFMLHK